MKLFSKFFKKEKKEEEKFETKKLNSNNIKDLELEYKDNPHFIAICEYDECYKPIYKSDKYNTIKENNGDKKKFHTNCLRKMKKQAKKLINKDGTIKSFDKV